MGCIIQTSTTGSLDTSLTLLLLSAGAFHTKGGTDQRAQIDKEGTVTGSLDASVTGSLGASTTGSLEGSTTITLNATWCYKRAGAS